MLIEQFHQVESVVQISPVSAGLRDSQRDAATRDHMSQKYFSVVSLCMTLCRNPI